MAIPGCLAASNIFEAILNKVECDLGDIEGNYGQVHSKAEILDHKEKVVMMRQVEHVLDMSEVCEERGPKLKDQLMDCKRRVELEENRFCANSAKLNHEIASLRVEDHWDNEPEMDMLLELEESVNCELQDVQESLSCLESRMDYHDSEVVASTLEELQNEIKELEEKIACLQNAEKETSITSNGLESNSLGNMLSKLKSDSCWNCSMVLEEAGQEKLSINVVTHMDRMGARHTHNLTVGFNFSQCGNPLQATMTEATLFPADISQDELLRKIESSVLAGDGVNRLRYFVQQVVRCLFWKLPRQTALDEVRSRYSFRSLNAEGSRFRCALPCGIEAEVDIPLLWPNEETSCLALVSAHAPVLTVDLEPAVTKFRGMEIDARISLTDFLVRLDSWLKDYLRYGTN